MSESQIHVARDIAADAEQVWAMVADVTRMPEWSPETVGCEWLGGARGPAVGAKFRGRNRNGKKSWSSVATVVDAEPGKVFAFTCKAGGLNIAEWRYSFEPTENGCRVTETWTDRRGAFLRAMGTRATGVADREAHNRAGMETTLERLDSAATTERA
jgi:uncharacterized protein YndB with AHSA1/START domain